MTKQADPLKNLRVASPCHVGWEKMSGTDRVRFCDSCNLNVYNFADMTTTEIRSLLLEMNGQICGRLHRRADGTIITRDCPVGLRALHQRVTRFAGAVFATVLSICSVVFSQSRSEGLKQTSQFMSELQIERDKSNNEQSGTFKGLVVDINGASIVGAEVILRSPFNNKKRVVYTDDTGVFTFTDVKDGSYMLNVSAPGFRAFRADYIELNADEYATTRIKLFVASPQMPVSEATLGFVISDPEIDNPLILRPVTVQKRPINN
jgi:hypothetical protein